MQYDKFYICFIYIELMNQQDNQGQFMPPPQQQYYGGPGNQAMTPQQMAQLQQQGQLQGQQPQAIHPMMVQPDLAGMINDQLVQEVPAGSYIDPNMQKMMMQQQQGMGNNMGDKIPEIFKEPLVVFFLVVVFAHPMVTSWLSTHITPLAGEGGKSTTVSVLITALFVALSLALINKFVLKK